MTDAPTAAERTDPFADKAADADLAPETVGLDAATDSGVPIGAIDPATDALAALKETVTERVTDYADMEAVSFVTAHLKERDAQQYRYTGDYPTGSPTVVFTVTLDGAASIDARKSVHNTLKRNAKRTDMDVDPDANTATVTAPTDVRV